MPHVFPRGAIQTLKELENLKRTKLWISPCSTLGTKNVVPARYLEWDELHADPANIHLHFDDTVGGILLGGDTRMFWVRKLNPTVIPFDSSYDGKDNQGQEWHGFFFTNYWFAYAAFVKYLKSNSKEESE